MNCKSKGQWGRLLWEALIIALALIQQPDHLSQDSSGMVKGGSHLYAQVVCGLIWHCPASSLIADALVSSVCIML